MNVTLLHLTTFWSAAVAVATPQIQIVNPSDRVRGIRQGLPLKMGAAAHLPCESPTNNPYQSRLSAHDRVENELCDFRMSHPLGMAIVESLLRALTLHLGKYRIVEMHSDSPLTNQLSALGFHLFPFSAKRRNHDWVN